MRRRSVERLWLQKTPQLTGYKKTQPQAWESHSWCTHTRTHRQTHSLTRARDRCHTYTMCTQSQSHTHSRSKDNSSHIRDKGFAIEIALQTKMESGAVFDGPHDITVHTHIRTLHTHWSAKTIKRPYSSNKYTLCCKLSYDVFALLLHTRAPISLSTHIFTTP